NEEADPITHHHLPPTPISLAFNVHANLVSLLSKGQHVMRKPTPFDQGGTGKIEDGGVGSLCPTPVLRREAALSSTSH
ncbi:hypothetical protein B296_00010102, partial [Ensete ventricosum]